MSPTENKRYSNPLSIKICDTELEVAQSTDKLLGKKLITNQTGPAGKIINRVYIEEATQILEAMDKAEKSGQGAAVYKGRLIDIASIKQAKVILDQAKKIYI